MRIEEAIKQKSFNDVYQKALVNLIFTGNWITGEHNKAIKPHGVSLQQYNILRILRGQKGAPISVNALIDRMLDKMSNASRLVEKLRQKGYVERKVCPNDRRQVDVLLTNEGEEFLRKLDTEIQAVTAQCENLLTPEEADQLSNLLDKLRLSYGSEESED